MEIIEKWYSDVNIELDKLDALNSKDSSNFFTTIKSMYLQVIKLLGIN